MPPTDDGPLSDLVRALAEPVADDHDVVVRDVQVKGHHGRQLVRVVVDQPPALPAVLDQHEEVPPAGPDVDVIAEVSRALGAALDAQDLIADRYTLEVSSPGVGTPLRDAADFARNLGREVRLIRQDETREHRGVVVRVEPDLVELVADERHTEHRIGDIDHGTVVLPW